MNHRYRLIGESSDGLLLFQDSDYPSDAPQSYVDDARLRSLASSDPTIDGDKYFAVTRRHAEIRGLIASSFADQ